MARKSDEQQIMKVLIELAEEENRLTESMVDMMAQTNELAARRTASADMRTTLSEERTDLAREQTKFISKSTDLAEKRTVSSDTRTTLSEERDLTSQGNRQRSAPRVPSLLKNELSCRNIGPAWPKTGHLLPMRGPISLLNEPLYPRREQLLQSNAIHSQAVGHFCPRIAR